jgi:hypothetical protein
MNTFERHVKKLGKTVTKDSFGWKVIEEHYSDDLPDNSTQSLGVKNRVALPDG